MKNWTEERNKIKSLSKLEKENLDIAVEIVSVIIKRRNELGISQRDLAKITGIKQSSIARFEGLGSIPRIDSLLKLIKPLGLKLLITRKN